MVGCDGLSGTAVRWGSGGWSWVVRMLAGIHTCRLQRKGGVVGLRCAKRQVVCYDLCFNVLLSCYNAPASLLKTQPDPGSHISTTLFACTHTS